MAEVCDDPTGVCLHACAHVNWTSICALGFSNNWACCDLDVLNAVLPTTLWAIFLGLSLWFGWFTGIVRELRTSVDDLHDINTQALGVVVARQTRSVLGHEIGDPRRVLMLLAMGSELVGFSYLPVQLLLYEYTNGTFAAQSSAGFQWMKFCLFTLLLWLLLLPRCITRRIDGLLTKVVAPLLFDTCSLLYMYTIIDIGACSNGMDTWTLPDGTTCGSASRYGVFAALGTTSFVLFYWHSLQYKLRLNDQVFAVRFRYQTSFGSLMAYTRTACCLGFFTVQRLLLYFDKIHVFLAFSIFNMALFSLLLRYNYVNQPCLGVGLFPNNLRSLSFATSVYTSTILFGISCALQASGTESMSQLEQHVFHGAAVAYIPFAIATWTVNSRRARLYHVPNLSLKASLVHSTPRVRAIAAVSIALEDQSRWSTSDILDLLQLLDDNLKTSPAIEQGLVLAYTCQALWNIYFKYVSIDTPFQEPGTDPTLSLGLWSNQRISVPGSLGPMSFHSRSRSHVSALLALVQRNVAVGAHTMTQHMDALSSSPLIASILPNCIHTLVLLSRISASPTRLIAAKVLQEMYGARILRLSQPTMLYVCCSICASASPSQSSAAAVTLSRLFVSHFECSESMTAHFTDYWNLVHLSQYLLRASPEPSEVARAEGIAHVVLNIVQLVESNAASSNPANSLSEAFVANILAAQAQTTSSYMLLTLLDDICLSAHSAFQVYLNELHRTTRGGTMRKRKRERSRLFSHAKTMTAIAPSLTPMRHTELSVQKITSFLLQSKQANLIEPEIVAAIKKRKAEEALLLVQVNTIVNEGCRRHLGLRELRPSTLTVLKTVLRHVKDQPMLRDHIKRRLKPAEADYLGLLERLNASKNSSGLRLPMLSARKIGGLIMSSSMYIDPSTNQTVPWHRLCTSSIAANVDWSTVCAMAYSANWPCCGLDLFNYLPCLSLWPIYGCLTAIFCWYSDIFVDFKSTVDELHHIQTQALGVVIARQKQVVMGKQVSDPRRLLMLLAMWTELPGFSFIPYQLLHALYNGGDYVAQLPASVQLGKFVVLTTFLVLYMCAPVLGPRMETLRHQVLAPFLFDSCFMTYLYSIVDVGGCANSMDQATWLGGSCGHPQHYQVFFAIALLVFVVYYWGTLQYKLKLSDQVFAVRFRFQTSFNSLMTFTRTACCLGFYTMQKLVLYAYPVHVAIFVSLLNGILFAMLLRYNYRMQPCLGVGRFPNNLRTLSFATSCYTSFAATLLGVIVKAQGKVTASTSDFHVISALTIVYPVFALYVWRFNHKRATLFQVPNLSLIESLEHPTPRVRAIAAVCVTLEPFVDMCEIELIVEKLDANLQREPSAEHFMVGAYTCQALWHLWFKYVHLQHCLFELDEPELCLPFGLWKTVAAPRILARLHRKQDSSLSSRLWQSDRGWLLTGTDQLRARLESFKPQTQGRRLVQLVQRATDIGWTTRNQKLLASHAMERCFAKNIHVCATLLRCNSSAARLLCAKLLHEMYICECVQMTKSTMIAMMCILCGDAQETLAKSAVLTILSWFQDQLHTMPADVVRLATTVHLEHMSQFVRYHHARNDNLSVRLLHFLIELLDAIAPLQIEPPNYLCSEYVENLVVAQTECSLYSMHLLIDKHCAGLHAIYAAYMRQIDRLPTPHLVPKRKRSLLGLGKGATAVVPLPSSSSGSLPPSWIRRGSSLLGRFGSNDHGSFVTMSPLRAPVSAEQYAAIMERKQIASTILADIRFLLREGQTASTPLKVICRHRTARRVFSALQRYPVYLDYLRDHITYLDYDYIRRLCVEMARWQFFQPMTDASSRIDRVAPGQPQWTEYSLRPARPVLQSVARGVDLADVE